MDPWAKRRTKWLHRFGERFRARRGSGFDRHRAAMSSLLASIMLVTVVVMGASGTAFIIHEMDLEPQAPIIATFEVEIVDGNGLWADGDEQILLRQLAGAPVRTQDIQVLVSVRGTHTILKPHHLEEQVGERLEAGEQITWTGTLWPTEEVSMSILGARSYMSNIVSVERVNAPDGLTAFGIDAGGGIFTRCPINATAHVVGTEITQGENGPVIPVTVRLTRDGASTYADQFGGGAVSGGESESLGLVVPGERLGIEATADNGNGWVKVRPSINGMPNVYVLLDGHSPPDKPGFAGQGNLSTYLEPYVDTATGTMDLSSREAMVLVEFVDNLTAPSADFQDLVYLFDFEDDVCPPV